MKMTNKISTLHMLQEPQAFRVVYGRGKSFANRELVFYIHPNQMQINRMGISISKKVGIAVRRNQLRRRLKDIIRRQGYPFIGYDIIFIVRPKAENLSYKNLETSVLHLFHKAMNQPQKHEC